MKTSCSTTSVVNLFKVFLMTSSLLFLAGCWPQKAEVSKDEIQELKGDVFGSYYILKFRGNIDKAELLPDLDNFFKEFNNEFSTYQGNSVISKFNQSPKNTPLKVSARFIEMLKLAQKFYQETNGAFDPTLGPVIKVWGFGGGKEKKVPAEADLKKAMAKVGFSFVKWDEKASTVWKEKDGVELDVNAFVPGWAGDLIGEMLLKKNIKDFMIDISGDILFHGNKFEDGTMWIAGIEKPSKEYGKGIHIAVKMKNHAISTSGNYRQFFDENGERKSHIIDPRTGKPVEHHVSSASVISKSGVEADAWSTAMMVLGPKGLALSEKNDIKVLLLVAEKPGVFTELVSPSMERFIGAHIW